MSTEEPPEGSPPSNRVYKRKRVAKACQTCRNMKSKCDGQHPECGRCKGYGYACVYRPRQPRQGVGSAQGSSHDVYGPLSELLEAVGEQKDLLDRLVSLLPDTEEKEQMLAKHSLIKTKLDGTLSAIGAEAISQAFTPDSLEVGDGTLASTVKSPSYLGEVSDVRFFNLVKRVLESQDGSQDLSKEFESYDQGDSVVSTNFAISKTTQLPDLDAAEEYIDAYFTTIHLAYPFIPETIFRRDYRTAKEQPQSRFAKNSKLALIYTICAIGAYYTSFPGDGRGADTLHERYYLRSLTMSPAAGTERSLDQVSLLLARCFYLLVICRTESCWTTLGQAIRVAQSIGLHVDSADAHKTKSSGVLEAEQKRRVWYSIYVLDRLLSLQLGRPPGIHDDDYYVPLPSRAGDSDIDWDSEYLEETSDETSSGDYFLSVIAFSVIVGRVLRSLYCPTRVHVTSDDLATTQILDQQLLKWKTGLPRVLRFDLGHAFEQSCVFKRQRNMLAIKYHHLRALIHRPYLCYPLLKHVDDSDVRLAQEDLSMMSAYERTCIMEARETARLLHGLSSQQDLVHSFPWWQMISCIVCAGSILLISSIFTQMTRQSRPEFDAEELQDDAETCLTVFDALSMNSAGARIARDMMKALKECGIRWTESNRAAASSCKTNECNSGATLQSPALTGDMIPAVENSPQEFDPHSPLSELLGTTTSYWPAEIVDSMTWSAQFLDVTGDRRDGNEGPSSRVGDEEGSFVPAVNWDTSQGPPW